VIVEEGSSNQEVEQLRKEVAELKQKLEEREQTNAALRQEMALFRSTFETMPDGIIVVNGSGELLASNPASERTLGVPLKVGEAGAWSEEHGFHLSDKVTPYPRDDLPLSRAMRGEEIDGCEIFVRNPSHQDGLWLSVSARPLRDPDGAAAGALAVTRDISDRKKLEEDLAERNRQLLATEAEKGELIGRLRTAIQELSTPILELWEDVLALPVIGVVDSRRSAEMMERLLEEVVRYQARFVILDLTGVEVVDTQTADHFIKLVKAVELIGARCVLTGIRPAVAQTLVDLDVEFSSLETLRNLKHGLRRCLNSLHSPRTWERAGRALEVAS
jgi:rsbT co-antagonist protein RsbR